MDLLELTFIVNLVAQNYLAGKPLAISKGSFPVKFKRYGKTTLIVGSTIPHARFPKRQRNKARESKWRASIFLLLPDYPQCE